MLHLHIPRAFFPAFSSTVSVDLKEFERWGKNGEENGISATGY